MKHARQDYNERIQDSAGEIPADEPVFLLRGQDELAGRTVKYHAGLMLAAGADIENVQAVTRQAQAMHLWPRRKLPDAPMVRTTLTAGEVDGAGRLEDGQPALVEPNDVSRETLDRAEAGFHAMLAGVVLDFASYLTGEGANEFLNHLDIAAVAGDGSPDPNVAHALIEGMKAWAVARHIDDRHASMDWRGKLYPGARDRTLDQ